MIFGFLENDLLVFLGIPFLICIAKIIDVTLGTVRLILISKGVKNIATLLAFIQISIWLFTLNMVLTNLHNILNAIGYALGYSVGTYVGFLIEEKLAIGNVAVHIITNRDARKLFNYLNEEGYKATIANADDSEGRVNNIYVIIKRKKIKKVVGIIKEFHPNSFYTIEDIRYLKEKAGSIEPSGKDVFLKKLNFFFEREK